MRNTGTTVDVAVDVHDLVKRYPKSRTNAVDGLTFSVPPGEVSSAGRDSGAAGRAAASSTIVSLWRIPPMAWRNA